SIIGHSIVKLNNAAEFILSWGGLGTGPGQFSDPVGIALDAMDNVYVIENFTGCYREDGGTLRVQKFTNNGEYIGEFAAEGRAIAVGSIGDIYVAGWGEAEIKRYSMDGILMGAWGSGGSGPGQFDTLFSLTVDHAGNVYAVELNGQMRVQKFSGDGTFLS